jgi:UDP-MurNAc hydroxylase
MKVTNIGHAGLFIETAAGSILCDPWFTPAYFGSWFPFPAHDGLDLDRIARPDYLYISHLHKDHYDRRFLAEHVDKDATVLLPDYPMPYLRQALTELGFRRFVTTRSGEQQEVGGLRLMILSLTAPNDGPIGDSCLAVDDGTATILDQNDARPPDFEALARFGAYDGHWLQFSGAIWYPVVYDLPARAKHALGRQKRLNGMERARRYVEAVGARHVFPHAGPAAFLDGDLFALNDLGDDGNPFPDATVFLDHLANAGHREGVLLVPGATAELTRTGCDVRHPAPEAEAFAPYTDKRGYLERYRKRVAPLLAAERASWPTGVEPLLPELAEWWDPLLEQAQHLCARAGDRVLIDTGREKIVIDFLLRRVVPFEGQDCRYSFDIDDPLVRACVRDREDDWVNRLFLSCRFTASRRGPYNEHVYTWFKSLSPEKIDYVEEWLTTDRDVRELWRFGDWLVQRRCPHLSGDLSRFGHLDGGVLTCDLHGWQFDVASGRCLTSDDAHLYSEPVEQYPGWRPTTAEPDEGEE